jgi:hypothetical protein
VIARPTALQSTVAGSASGAASPVTVVAEIDDHGPFADVDGRMRVRVERR